MQIANLSVTGAGVRQTARALGVAHSTVQRHLARAGRHCLIAHRHMLKGKPRKEPVVFDGFESFEFSQYFPCHYNLAVGEISWLLYHFTDSPLRRKGRMTAGQKERRAAIEAALGRPDPKAVEKGVLELLRVVADLVEPVESVGPVASVDPRTPEPTMDKPAQTPPPPDSASTLVLKSDEHPAYPRALRQLRREPQAPPILHLTTPSRRPRTQANPLFAVNSTDRLLRHCGANHRRETIASNKRRQGGLERLAIFMVWKNAIKARKESRPGETAAMTAGLLSKPLTWRALFSRRVFPRPEELPGSWWSYYWREVRTQALGEMQTSHRCTYAF